MFGSAARGESGLTSDVDLCIVVPDSTKTGVAELIRQKVLSKLQAEGVKTGEVPGGGEFRGYIRGRTVNW